MIFMEAREKSSPSDEFISAPGAMNGVPTKPVSWGKVRKTARFVSLGEAADKEKS
jgi:hypothetical protein